MSKKTTMANRFEYVEAEDKKQINRTDRQRAHTKFIEDEVTEEVFRGAAEGNRIPKGSTRLTIGNMAWTQGYGKSNTSGSRSRSPCARYSSAEECDEDKWCHTVQAPLSPGNGVCRAVPNVKNLMGWQSYVDQHRNSESAGPFPLPPGYQRKAISRRPNSPRAAGFSPSNSPRRAQARGMRQVDNAEWDEFQAYRAQRGQRGGNGNQ